MAMAARPPRVAVPSESRTMVRWPAAPRRASSCVEPLITAAGSSAAERSQRSDSVHTAGSTSRMCSPPSAFTATSVSHIQASQMKAIVRIAAMM